MAKEAFNRKRSIFCGPLEKELWKRLVKCFVWRVALYGAFQMWIWKRMERVRWTDKIKMQLCWKEWEKEEQCWN